MTNRKVKLKNRMAVALSLQDYLGFFLLKNDDLTVNEGKEKSNGQSKRLLLVATVYKSEIDGSEDVLYSRRILGGKNADPLSTFVEDMIGNTDKVVNGGSLQRTASLSDMNGGMSDAQLPRNSSITIDILASRSPSKIGTEQIQKLLNYCKRNSIKVSLQFTFAHPFSWDNKYNREGIKDLHDKGVKLKPLTFQQGLNKMVNDIQDTLESIDELQTCRGTVSINYYMLRRAIAKFRDALILKGDSYCQDNEENLKEITGHTSRRPTQTSNRHKLTSFSAATYRDYFLLQNTDEIWAKLRVTLTKFKNDVTQDQVIYEEIYNTTQLKNGKKLDSHNADRNTLDKEALAELVKNVWSTIGNNITLNELASHEEIIVNATFTVSEYPDRMGWHNVFRALHRHLTEKLYDTRITKVHLESIIRYAMNISASSSGSASGRSTPSIVSNQSSKAEADRDHQVALECMHIQDILFELLEDLEDNLTQMGRIDYDRGAHLIVDKQTLSIGLGLLNRATTVRTEDGKVHSMNDEFSDAYLDSIGQV